MQFECKAPGKTLDERQPQQHAIDSGKRGKQRPAEHPTSESKVQYLTFRTSKKRLANLRSASVRICFFSQSVRMAGVSFRYNLINGLYARASHPKASPPGFKTRRISGNA